MTPPDDAPDATTSWAKPVIFITTVFLLLLTLFVIGPLWFFFSGYGEQKYNEGRRYWSYVNYIASYSYVRAHEPNSACRDPDLYRREYAKQCSFVRVKGDTALARQLLPKLFGRRMTMSFPKGFPRAREILQHDFDRRCELLEELGWRFHPARDSEDCRPGAFIVEEAADHLLVRVTRNVLRSGSLAPPMLH